MGSSLLQFGGSISHGFAREAKEKLEELQWSEGERGRELLDALGKGLVDLNQVTVEGKKKEYKYRPAPNGHLSAALPH